VKHFHLAFKGIDTPEIYDILMGHLVATIKGYDPAYTDKVKLLVEVIENELSTRKQFSFADVNRHLDFDCNRYIRLLGPPWLPPAGTTTGTKALADGRADRGVATRTWSAQSGRSRCCYSEGQQLLQRLLGLVKVYGDAARLQPDAFGKVLELLLKDLDRSLDQELRPFQPVLVEFGQDFSELAPAPALVKAIVPAGKAAQMSDEGIPVRQTAGADAVGNAGGHDLLRPAAADAEQEFDRGPVDERAGKGLQLPEDLVDSAVPSWFGGHGGDPPMLVRTRAKWQVLKE
jgi:hypothetical protein